MRPRLAFALATALGLAGLASSVAAADSTGGTASRTVTDSYVRAGGVTSNPYGPVVLWPGPWQQATHTEDHARVTATDTYGRIVALKVDYVPRGSATPTSQVFCGSTPNLAIAAGSQVRATTLAGTCLDGTVSLPMKGTVAIVFTRPLPPRRPPGIPADRRWAVLVGVQQYAGNTHPTYGGRGDVEAIKTALLHSGWRADHIKILLDSAAGGQNILDAMSWLAARSGPDTYSLFHFSGHVCIASRGPCGSGHTYLWAYDNSFVPETSVGQALGQVQGRAWFDFAGCESGAFDAGLHSAKRLVTASSQASETSYEEPSWNESVWSGLVWDHAFLQGEAGPSPNRATVAQMVGFGRDQAPQVTAGQSAGAQHPYVAGDLSESLYAPHP